MAEGSDKVVIAYPPIKRIIKQEIPEERQETNTIEEENGALQILKDSVVMEEPLLIAYQPIKRTFKQEILDEHPQNPESWRLQLPKDSVTDGHTNTTNSGLLIANASLSSEDSGKSMERLRVIPNQSSGDLQPNFGTLEEEETQQDTEMVEELDSEEESFDNDKGYERSEHSSLEDFDESEYSIAPDSSNDEHSILDPKAGPSKEPTRQVQKASNRKRRENDSKDTDAKKRPFKCGKCKRSYSQKCTLITHVNYECGSEPRFSCTQCNGQFKRKNHLQRHLITVHKIDQDQLDKHGAGLKERQMFLFKCSKCERSFKRKRALVQHVNHECGVKFICTECKQNFKTKCSLRIHLLSVHMIARRELDKFGAGYKVRLVQPYKCDQCDRTYRNKGSLTQHKKIECGVEPSFLCPQCVYRTKRKSDLKVHLMEVHSVERSQLATFGLGPVIRPDTPFKCDLCGTCFKRKKYLNRHTVLKCGK